MPKNATLRRQRAAGGAFGVLVLAFALTYHFFPRLLHVDPTQIPRRSMSLGVAAPGNGAPARRTSVVGAGVGDQRTQRRATADAGADGRDRRT